MRAWSSELRPSPSWAWSRRSSSWTSSSMRLSNCWSSMASQGSPRRAPAATAVANNGQPSLSFAAVVERIDDMPAGTIGFRASGKLTVEDYREVLVPGLQEAVDSGEVRLLFVLTDFDELEPKA